MTTPAPRRHLLTVSVLAATLLVGSTGGAVAGSMITGRQIKDRSVQTRDLSRPTVASLSRIQGYERRRAGVSVEPNQEGFVTVTCPKGKRVLGGDGYFGAASTGLRLSISADGHVPRT